jgi:hypothetical protein
LASAKRLPASATLGGPSQIEELGEARSTISATSKLPSGSGLAMSKMPGSVVPGPFGSFVSAGAVVGMGLGEVVGDGEAEGVRTVGVEAAADGALVATVGADRGSSASR